MNDYNGRLSDYVIDYINEFIATVDSFKGTPIHQALFQRDADGYSILHHAVLTNNPKLIQSLIMILVKLPNGNKIINSQDKYGLSPLHWSVLRRCDKAISILVEYGNANINIQNYEGRTPLSFAVDRFSDSNQNICNDESKNQFDLQLTNYLLSRGASPHISDISGMTPLHLVSSFGDIEMMKRLIESGSNINQCDSDGENSLFYAIRSGSIDTVKQLVQVYNVDLFIENNVNETPFEYALACADEDICNYLRSLIISRKDEPKDFNIDHHFQVKNTRLSQISVFSQQQQQRRQQDENKRSFYIERMECSSSQSNSMIPPTNSIEISLSAGAHFSKLPAFSAQSAF